MKKPQLEKMTLREKIAQTLLVRQCDLLLHAENDYMTKRAPEEAAEFMEKYQYGGIWIHGNLDVNGIKGSLTGKEGFDTKSHNEWLKKVEEKAKYPLLLANDSCGNGSFSDLGQVMQGLIIGAANDEELSYNLGYNQAVEHALAGHNWLWSPVVDLTSVFMADIVRPAASDPEILTKQSIAFAKGMQAAGVAATAKHFPGDDTTDPRDSHIVASKINVSLEKWEETQGKVFQSMIDAGVYSIMTAAIAFPAVDSNKKDGKYYPASLSHAVITGLLKEKMGFSGVVITDDVTMGGYTSFYGHDDLYIELLKAGNDVLLGVGVDALDIVEKGVADGRLSEERINDACSRILDMKEKLGLFDENRKVHNISVEEAKKISKDNFQKVAEKGITLLRNNVNLVPVSKENIKKVTIIMYSHRNVMPALEDMKKSFEARGAEVVLRDKLESFTDVKKVAEESDLIVYAGYIGHHAPKGAPSFYDEVFWSLRYAFTEGIEKSIGVSLGYPFIHHDFMDDSLCFFNLYRPTAEIQEAFVKAVYGEIKVQGISPVDLSIKCGKNND